VCLELKVIMTSKLLQLVWSEYQECNRAVDWRLLLRPLPAKDNVKTTRHENTVQEFTVMPNVVSKSDVQL